MSNLYHIGQRASAAPDRAEPIEEAVRELSARVAENNDARRLLFSRLDELRGLSPGLRRRRVRQPIADPSRAVTFYSIEEAGADEAQAPLQVARGGR